MNSDPGAVTELLGRWQAGDEDALEALIPQVYDELRRLARAQLRRDAGASIQPTELVAEAYLRLIDVDRIDWQGRVHFYSVAARTMRRVLVDRYRRRAAARRGGEQTLLTFRDELGDGSAGTPVELDRLDDALQTLEGLDARQAEIVVLRFFGGLSVDEVGDVLSISPRTVKREWSMARRWLYREMARD